VGGSLFRLIAAAHAHVQCDAHGQCDAHMQNDTSIAHGKLQRYSRLHINALFMNSIITVTGLWFGGSEGPIFEFL
jgi:hypothetical protein